MRRLVITVSSMRPGLELRRAKSDLGRRTTTEERLP